MSSYSTTLCIAKVDQDHQIFRIIVEEEWNQENSKWGSGVFIGLFMPTGWW